MLFHDTPSKVGVSDILLTEFRKGQSNVGTRVKLAESQIVPMVRYDPPSFGTAC